MYKLTDGRNSSPEPYRFKKLQKAFMFVEERTVGILWNYDLELNEWTSTDNYWEIVKVK